MTARRKLLNHFAMILLTAGLVTACRGDGDYGDAGETTGRDRACPFTCVEAFADCAGQGQIVQGECPDDGLCCNTEGGGRDTNGRGNEGTDDRTACEYDCVGFGDCPRQGLVPHQACEGEGEVCCDTEVVGTDQ